MQVLTIRAHEHYIAVRQEHQGNRQFISQPRRWSSNKRSPVIPEVLQAIDLPGFEGKQPAAAGQNPGPAFSASA